MRFIKFTLPANTLFYPLYAHIWYPICFGHSSESIFVCITESSILLKKSLNGQHLIKQICRKILGMICLVMNYNLVKKNSKYLNNKIWTFPISYTELPISNQMNCIHYGLKWPRPSSHFCVLYNVNNWQLTIQVRSFIIFISCQNDNLETSCS